MWVRQTAQAVAAVVPSPLDTPPPHCTRPLCCLLHHQALSLLFWVLPDGHAGVRLFGRELAA